MPAEASHERGRRGVALVKRWLEATTHIELPWNAYETPAQCAVRHLAGAKQFDLAGFFLTSERQPLVVESKSYRTEGHQPTEFQEFLAIAYSATALAESEGADARREFLWVTTHPFGPMTKWSTWATEDAVLAAVAANPKLMAESAADQGVARRTAERVWLLVLNEKQERISLTADEMQKAVRVLKRKASTL